MYPNYFLILIQIFNKDLQIKLDFLLYCQVISDSDGITLLISLPDEPLIA